MSERSCDSVGEDREVVGGAGGRRTFTRATVGAAGEGEEEEVAAGSEAAGGGEEVADGGEEEEAAGRSGAAAATAGDRRHWGRRGGCRSPQIRDLHIAKRVEDIGYYAGFVGGAYMFGRALTSVLWGIVADRYGRKPVIVISIVSLILFNTLFGLSTSYWMAITARFLLGASSGLLGPIKAYATEVCRKEYQALGLSLVSTSRGIGLILGPAIGGFFAQPADKYPDIFSKESFFGRFPYFLPCFVISLIGVGASIACFWLPETLHIHSDYEWESNSAGALEASLNSSVSKESESGTKGGPASKENLLRNWPLLSSMIVFCVFSLHDMAYSEIFSLWAVSDKKYGGLSFSSGDVGEILAISGFTLLLYQLFLYAPFVKAVGPINSTRISAVLMIPLLAGFPYMVNLSGVVLKTVVNCASILKYVFSMTIITGLNILQNNAVSQNQRGAANGISVTAMSLFKTAAPAGGGAIFSWAQKHQHGFFFPGDQIIFFVLNVIGVIGILMTFKPFLALPTRNITT